MQTLATNFLYDHSLEEEMRLQGAQDNEVEHMYDVSKIMKTIDIFFYLLLLKIFFISLYYKKKKINFHSTLRKSAYASLGLPLLLLFFALVGFNFAFTLFHNIFFPQGNWQFASNSFLITTFPITFFSTIAIKIFVINLIFALFFLIYEKHFSK